MEILAETYISKLNEYKQKTGSAVQYEDGSTEGPSHNKTFTCTAVVNGTRYPAATGKTKREAKHNAAKNAFTALTHNTPERVTTSTHNTPERVTTSTNDTPTSSTQASFNNKSITHMNYISWLNEYSQKNRVEFKIREDIKMDPVTQLSCYVCKYVCGNKEYPEAYGRTKEEAKKTASKYVYEELCTAKTSEVLNENCKNTSGSEVEGLCAGLDHCSLAEDSQSVMPDDNYIAYLNEYCQKHKCVAQYTLVEKKGPSHNPEFVMRVVINGKEFSEAHGKNLKEAKQQAAQKALNELQSSEENTSAQNSQIHKSEEELVSRSSDSVVFRDSSAMCSPMAISPAMTPTKPKTIRLAANFHVSPNDSFRNKGNGVNMNVPTQTKPSANHTATQAVKSRFLEDFDSISRIGKGGFGSVFKARRKLENQYFAVKIVKSTKKALREVNALSKLHHPNIIRYNTAWEEESRYVSTESNSNSDSGSSLATKFLYIQMELCEGDTLRVWIDQRSEIKGDDTERKSDAAHIYHQILQAVKYIHAKDLIHRDLKPLNIMFGSEGGVKVGDFGLVTAAENDNDEQQQRTRGPGTRSYMSPEQVTSRYDRKVDIFALGLIYFELLWNIGTVSEKSKIWGDLKSRIFPPGFSDRFGFEHKLICKMLNVDAKHRPDASELILDLQRCSTIS